MANIAILQNWQQSSAEDYYAQSFFISSNCFACMIPANDKFVMLVRELLFWCFIMVKSLLTDAVLGNAVVRPPQSCAAANSDLSISPTLD